MKESKGTQSMLQHEQIECEFAILHAYETNDADLGRGWSTTHIQEPRQP